MEEKWNFYRGKCLGLDHWFSNLHVHHSQPEGWSETDMLGSIPGVALSVGLRWSLRTCMFYYKFPGDSDAAGPTPHFKKH